jgi:hypothetical protein
MTNGLMSTRVRRTLAALSFAASGTWLAAQAPAPEAATKDTNGITEARVRETVTWLAADERAGRDTGSPELIAAGEWIAARFAAAGLEQVQPGSWYHEFPMKGAVLDSAAIEFRLTRTLGEDVREVTFVADKDIRQMTPSAVQTGEKEACTVAPLSDPVMQRLLQAESARRPILCEVAEDDPKWLAAAGSHSVMATRRQAARPVFLVRAGLLPPPPPDRREPSWSATWKVAAAAVGDVHQRNVMALRPGTTKKGEYVVVSAHYDHIGVTSRPRDDGDRICNGADDNATGTTAVLLLAEAMAKLPPTARSVLFVCFTAEERGLAGSAAFCKAPPVPLDAVVANLNVEMIGRPEAGKEGMAWITGADLSDFAAIVAPSLLTRDVALTEFAMAGRLFAASDNWSFAQKGVVAHSLSAGSLHADYHQVSDHVDKLDIPHMTKVIAALLQATIDLANRDAVPQWNEKGRAQLQRGRR